MTAVRLSTLYALPGLGFPDDSRTDAELLQRFRTTRDEVSFAILVARHTPAIRSVCRSWLRLHADIDDATQATFLVLVQRLDSIREPAALAAWLYRVAENVSRRMRNSAKSTTLNEDITATQRVTDEKSEALAEEIARLPEKYRLPIQLHYEAGLSTALAAERLGCPTNTLVTRLARARDLLQRRLANRGIVVAALFAATGTVARSVSPAWVWTTAQAAVAVIAGEPTNLLGVSDRTISLSQGVAQTMFWKNLKLIAAVLMIATGLTGFIVGQWATADSPKKLKDELQQIVQKDKELAKDSKLNAKPDEAKPDATQRRREAVIRLPIGSFMKEAEVAPYGSGRITWTYEDDRVLGVIEGNVMGAEFEIETEAEISLSSNGTIYGVVNAVRVSHLKFGGILAEGAEYAKFLPLAEPFINEMLTDLPFSYQFRMKGDRLTILNYRALMSGPNPLTKLAGVGGDLQEVGKIMLGFQALSAAMEGTYTSVEAKDKEAPKKRPLFRKSADLPKRAPERTSQLNPREMFRPTEAPSLPRMEWMGGALDPNTPLGPLNPNAVYPQPLMMDEPYRMRSGQMVFDAHQTNQSWLAKLGELFERRRPSSLLHEADAFTTP
jgi:RNA polymerase sigma factor (sigma-70 family)